MDYQTIIYKSEERTRQCIECANSHCLRERPYILCRNKAEEIMPHYELTGLGVIASCPKYKYFNHHFQTGGHYEYFTF